MIVPKYQHEEYGPEPEGELLVTLGIPTYRREAQLREFLERLSPVLHATAFRHRIEVVISNNASPDRTVDVVNAWLATSPPVRVRVYTHEINIGGEPNFRFIFEQARGAYVWSCSDHDYIHGGEVDRLLMDVDRMRPEVCVSSFVNYGTAKDQITVPGGAETLVVRDLATVVRRVNDIGKLSQYVMRRTQLSSADQSFSEQASEGRVWFSALSVRLFMAGPGGLLLRSRPIGHTGPEGHNLAYSVRVYGEIRAYVLAAISDPKEREAIARHIPHVDIMGPLVGHLFRNTLGLSKMKLDCAQSDFEYMKQHFRRALFHGWRTALKLPVILLFFPLRYRWRAASEDWTGVPKG